ncbi:MAG: hypothetical protein G5663_07355 [Serratia symbiotica]|nr:hypothetical protein [Serratia symbiotica]
MNNVEQVLRRGIATSYKLIAALCISQPTLSLRICTLAGVVLTFCKGKVTRYVLRHGVAGERQFPLYLVKQMRCDGIAGNAGYRIQRQWLRKLGNGGAVAVIAGSDRTSYLPEDGIVYWAFGKLIANSDMHQGNLSFRSRHSALW